MRLPFENKNSKIKESRIYLRSQSIFTKTIRRLKIIFGTF